jgi:hypothetical protein
LVHLRNGGGVGLRKLRNLFASTRLFQKLILE